jgi:hydroxymethylpyrimidine pyrophosphatase-like HAD family hydrolase
MAEYTRTALQRLRRSGRKVFLVTGEAADELPDFPHLELFDLAVAENGAVLYDPRTRKEQLLADHPPQRLLGALRRQGVADLKRGRVVISAECSQERLVQEVLDQIGSDWRLVKNRNKIMILPRNIDKASGLAAALARFDLCCDDVIGVGDAENDRVLLESCGCGVAVANAVLGLRKCATFVTTKGMGSGVTELIDMILKSEDAQPNGKFIARSRTI